mgnify:CR=1 FL=1
MDEIKAPKYYVIKQDITNNKDAKKLKILGSNLGAESFQGRCPVCNQKIQDSLLPVQHDTNVMSIEETINHLTAQKEMFEFAYEYQTNRKQQLSTALLIHPKTVTMSRLC